MRGTRALRNLFVLVGIVVTLVSILGAPIAWQMQPGDVGATLLVAVMIGFLISVLLFICAAILNALIEADRSS